MPRPLREIFGAPDDLKFISSMTLFGWAARGGIYQRALDGFNGGALDRRTLERLAF